VSIQKLSHPPRILLSDKTAAELAPKIESILGPQGYVRVTAKQMHEGTADADFCFVSRDVTSSSTKHKIVPETQYVYDALMGSKALKWVHIHSAGVDRQIFLDLMARGVTVTSSSGASAGVVAQTALTGLLSLARRFPQLAAAQRAHAWEPFSKWAYLQSLKGKPPPLSVGGLSVKNWLRG